MGLLGRFSQWCPRQGLPLSSILPRLPWQRTPKQTIQKALQARSTSKCQALLEQGILWRQETSTRSTYHIRFHPTNRIFYRSSIPKWSLESKPYRGTTRKATRSWYLSRSPKTPKHQWWLCQTIRARLSASSIWQFAQQHHQHLFLQRPWQLASLSFSKTFQKRL